MSKIKNETVGSANLRHTEERSDVSIHRTETQSQNSEMYQLSMDSYGSNEPQNDKMGDIPNTSHTEERSDVSIHNNNAVFESGRSMVEILGVLTVIGILSITAISGYNYAMRQNRVNELTNQLKTTAYYCSQRYLMDYLSGDCDISAFGTNYGYATLSDKYTESTGVNVGMFEGSLSGLGADLCDAMKTRLDEWNIVEVDPLSSCATETNNTLTFRFNMDLSDPSLSVFEPEPELEVCTETCAEGASTTPNCTETQKQEEVGSACGEICYKCVDCMGSCASEDNLEPDVSNAVEAVEIEHFFVSQEDLYYDGAQTFCEEIGATFFLDVLVEECSEEPYNCDVVYEYSEWLIDEMSNYDFSTDWEAEYGGLLIGSSWAYVDGEFVEPDPYITYHVVCFKS